MVCHAERGKGLKSGPISGHPYTLLVASPPWPSAHAFVVQGVAALLLVAQYISTSGHLQIVGMNRVWKMSKVKPEPHHSTNCCILFELYVKTLWTNVTVRVGTSLCIRKCSPESGRPHSANLKEVTNGPWTWTTTKADFFQYQARVSNTTTPYQLPYTYCNFINQLIMRLGEPNK